MVEMSKQLLAGMNATYENLSRIMGGEADFARTARSDLGMFLLYLSAVDGSISEEEVLEITQVLQISMTPSEAKKVYSQIKPDTFMTRIPASLKLAVNVDKALPMLKEQNGSSCAEMLIATYVHVGIDLVFSDKNVMPQERDTYNRYINMMRQYVASEMGR